MALSWSLRYLVLLSSLLFFNFAFAEFPSCECPKVNCDPCFQEQGVKFYSEKCGEDGARVRSCAKPTCELMDPLPSGCEQAVSNDKTAPRTPASSNRLAQAQAENVRLPAATKSEVRGAEVAEVKSLTGSAWLQPIGSNKESLKIGHKVHEKDVITTGPKSLVQLKFFDGNHVNLTEKSELKLDTYENNMSDKKRAILDLMKGSVRSKVSEKYNGDTSYFRVRTPSAVAGVRGTDFLVSYNQGETWVSEVTTFKGEVKFEGGGAPTNDSLSVHPGEQVRFVVAAPTSDVFTKDELQSFVDKGYMTPVYKMSLEELKRLEAQTESESPARNTASDKSASAKSSEPTCLKPAGDFNQCMWVCLNNPKGSDRCRTDLPQVHCARKRCDANGNWSDESRLPASFYETCDPRAPRVGPCDY